MEKERTMIEKITNFFIAAIVLLIHLSCFCFAAWLLVMAMQGLIVVL